MEKKTDMLTRKQFREKYKEKSFYSSLAFAIGADAPELMLEFNGEHSTPEIPFLESLKEYGLEVKKVDSFKDLDGKTGFILYGYYAFGTDFGVEMSYYHVLRVSPDKSKCIHLDDNCIYGAIYEKPDDDGSIGGHATCYGPMQFYMLLKEKNIDKDKIKDRMDSVFNKAKSVLESEKIDEENKSILTKKLQSVKTKLENQKETMFSYQINLLLEEVQEIVQDIVEKHKIEIEPEDFFK